MTRELPAEAGEKSETLIRSMIHLLTQNPGESTISAKAVLNPGRDRWARSKSADCFWLRGRIPLQ